MNLFKLGQVSVIAKEDVCLIDNKAAEFGQVEFTGTSTLLKYVGQLT